jgi:hypothetical protein
MAGSLRWLCTDPLCTQCAGDIIGEIALAVTQGYRPESGTSMGYDSSVKLVAAVNGQCSHIVTWNVRDFAPAVEFGIQIITPQAFLNLSTG